MNKQKYLIAANWKQNGDLKSSTKLSMDIYNKRQNIIKLKESISRLFSPIFLIEFMLWGLDS